MIRRRTRHLAATSVVLATLLVGGCGGDDDSGDGSNNNAQVCSDVDALRASVADVADVQLEAGALATLQEDLDQVRSEVSTLTTDAKDAYGDQLAAVDQAVSGLTTSLRSAVDNPSVDAMSAVRTSRQVLTTSVTALNDAVQSSC